MMRLASAFVLLALAVGCGRADEAEIPLKDVPARALAAVKKAFPNGKLDSATTGTEDDKTYYSIVLRQTKQTYEVTVTEDGTITEIAREIGFSELPKPVIAAVHNRYPKAKLGEAAELTVPGVKGKKYHIELTTANGKELEVVFDPTGKLLSEDESVSEVGS
jgi:hypothetical protein